MEELNANQSVEEEVIEPEVVEETAEDQQQTEGMTEAEKEAFLKIKYNKEEIELDKEKAAELAQKGMNYDKVKEKLDSLENDPRLSFVEQQAKKYDMSTEQYLEAVRQAEEQEQLNDLVQKHGVTEELAKEMMESRKFRETYENEKREREQAEQREQDYQAFLETFPDAKPEDIPESVWQEVEQGKSLVDAYTRHENQQLKEQLEQLKEKQEIEKQNEENAESSTGSLTGKGEGKQPYFTREQVAKMSTEEVNKNWKTINESMKKWS